MSKKLDHKSKMKDVQEARDSLIRLAVKDYIQKRYKYSNFIPNVQSTERYLKNLYPHFELPSEDDLQEMIYQVPIHTGDELYIEAKYLIKEIN